jgi:hypothetical protein
LLQRCSRPLCRSQPTNPPTTTRTHHAHDRPKEARATSQPADPSGPNSVPNPPPSLPHPHVPHPPPPHGARTGSTEEDGTTTRVLHRRFH